MSFHTDNLVNLKNFNIISEFYRQTSEPDSKYLLLFKNDGTQVKKLLPVIQYAVVDRVLKVKIVCYQHNLSSFRFSQGIVYKNKDKIVKKINDIDANILDLSERKLCLWQLIQPVNYHLLNGAISKIKWLQPVTITSCAIKNELDFFTLLSLLDTAKFTITGKRVEMKSDRKHEAYLQKFIGLVKKVKSVDSLDGKVQCLFLGSSWTIKTFSINSSYRDGWKMQWVDITHFSDKYRILTAVSAKDSIKYLRNKLTQLQRDLKKYNFILNYNRKVLDKKSFDTESDSQLIEMPQTKDRYLFSPKTKRQTGVSFRELKSPNSSKSEFRLLS